MIRSKVFFFVCMIFVFATLALAQNSFSGVGSGSSYSTYQSRPDFQTYYSSQINDYWPVLGNRETCEARQDILLNVAPAGCQPSVVRSDLLAEQNVPVFCQIDALKINPLIDIDRIRNIRFSGTYPPEVVGSGFHPARAALRTHDALLGSPLVNNVGYVVVVLKRQPDESKLPESVTVNLSAQLEYNSGNVLGTGRAEFILRESNTEAQWEIDKPKQTFWSGRYSVRLEESDPNFADVSIYNGDIKVATTRVKKGETSREIYFPGMYCQAGVQIAYDGFVAANNRARIEVFYDSSTEIFDVYQGSRFLNDACVVKMIDIDAGNNQLGKIVVNCAGQEVTLSLNNRTGIELKDATLPPNVRNYFDEAIRNYEDVAEDYPLERSADSEGAKRYGEVALERAKTLAEFYGQDKKKFELLNKLRENYLDPEYPAKYDDEFNELSLTDTTKAGAAVEINDEFYALRLVRVIPGSGANADFAIGNEKITVAAKQTIEMKRGNVKHGEFVFEGIEEDSAKVFAYCINSEGILSTNKVEASFRSGESKEICGLTVRLEKFDAEEFAKVRLLPKAQGTKTETSLAVSIGIEKRAIKLTPDKALERIDSLNKSIEEWDKISKNLGNVVSGLKGACFATAGILTFKNFLSGLSGEALARQEVMNGDHGWKQICSDLVPEQYPSLDACYLDKSSEIDRDVSSLSSAYTRVNQKIESLQAGAKTDDDIFGKSVDARRVRSSLAEEAKKYDTTIDLGDKPWVEDGQEFSQVDIDRIVSQENVDRGLVTTDQIRSMMLYSELKSSSLSESQRANVDAKMKEIALSVNNNMMIDENIKTAESLKGQGFATPFESSVATRDLVRAEVVPVSGQLTQKYPALSGFKHSATTITSDGVYILGLEQAPGGNYIVRKVVKQSDGGEVSDVSHFLTSNRIGNIKSVEAKSYVNEIKDSDRVVRFYETEPYKGMPAIVPFNVEEGWYAATKQTLPVFGGIGAFDASGRVTSFRLCNVGDNGRVDFENGLGDDLCQVINLNTGQPLGVFPGLSEEKARQLVSQAVSAIEQASRSYGQPFVRIGNNQFRTGKPALDIPETQCQDFMSPDDCHLMFNVCDPVVCPSSRCDFGGDFPVANVAQTGIAGSVLLCLPNIKEGIIIPVCLTGIQAGIDGWISIMKSYRDCLQENVNSGQTVGICDQIHSIYLCDFFWGQVAPFVNVLVPRLIETAYGQGTRGGAEYLTVNSAWQNMQSSIDYFTQSYAVNSLKSFQARTTGAYSDVPSSLFGGSISEIGGEFCKSFISAKAPNSLKTLVEPDSPPQFTAWFDSKKFSDATVPATAQYKVFYHIFAGNDAGVYFSVFLKNPPQSSYYATTPTVQVDSGFIPKGEYATQTKDFTAPEGYGELCVRINNEEECGFKQVSTSFAVNYLADSYAKQQIDERGVKTEKECIGGGSNAATLLNPNIQQGVEETISPEIYNRGITRICATQNPGRGTDETRFTDVGYCGDEKLRCWLDSRSVNNAITESNVLARQDALDKIEQDAYAALSGDSLAPDVAVGELKNLESEISKLESLSDNNKVESTGNTLLTKAGGLFDKLILNHHRAWLVLMKGEINDVIARSLPSVASSTDQTEALPKVKKVEEESVYTLVGSGAEREIYFGGDSLGFFVGETVTSIRGATFVSGEIYSKSGSTKNVIGRFDKSGTIDVTDEGVDEKIKYLEGRSYVSLKSGGIKYVSGSVAQTVVPSDSSQSSGDGECEITNMYWADESGEKIDSAVEGEEVHIVVEGDEDCEGEEVEFGVSEDDAISDDSSSVNPADAEFENGKAVGVWSAEFDDSLESGQPEYIFEVRVGSVMSGKSPELTVAEVAQGIQEEIEEPTTKKYALVGETLEFGGEPTGIIIRGQLISVNGVSVGSLNEQMRINIVASRYQDAGVSGAVRVHLERIHGSRITEDGKVVTTDTGEEITFDDRVSGIYTLSNDENNRKVLFNGGSTFISVVSGDFVWINLISATSVNPGAYNVGDIEDGLLKVDLESVGYKQADDETKKHLEELDGRSYQQLATTGISVG